MVNENPLPRPSIAGAMEHTSAAICQLIAAEQSKKEAAREVALAQVEALKLAIKAY